MLGENGRGGAAEPYNRGEDADGIRRGERGGAARHGGYVCERGAERGRRGVVFGARKHGRSRCAFLRAQFVALHPDSAFDARSRAHAEPRSRGGGHVHRRRARGGGGYVSHAPSRCHSYPSSARANNDATKR